MSFRTVRISATGIDKDSDKAQQFADEDFERKLDDTAEEFGLGASLVSFSHISSERDITSAAAIITDEYLTVWQVKRRNPMY